MQPLLATPAGTPPAPGWAPEVALSQYRAAAVMPESSSRDADCFDPPSERVTSDWSPTTAEHDVQIERVTTPETVSGDERTGFDDPDLYTDTITITTLTRAATRSGSAALPTSPNSSPTSSPPPPRTSVDPTNSSPDDRAPGNRPPERPGRRRQGQSGQHARNKGASYPMKGLMTCTICGRRMQVQKSAEPWVRYRCRARDLTPERCWTTRRRYPSARPRSCSGSTRG